MSKHPIKCILLIPKRIAEIPNADAVMKIKSPIIPEKLMVIISRTTKIIKDNFE